MEKNVIIGGRIHNPEVGNVAVGANEVLDDTKGKKQNVINTETDAELLRLENEKQDNLSFDNTPTENSTNPITSGGVYASELLIHQAIEMILALIPSAASALNQLADKSFVNSTVATATATFRGTYNVVTDLGLEFDATHEQIAAALLSHIATADNNDYAFVQIPVSATSTDIRVTERYKFNGTAWAYEYDLNNSGFTAAQWAAINSGITALLVSKLGSLPTAEELALALADKQNVLTFDNVPTSGSNNPVKSGGLYELFTAIDAKFPANASADNKLVAEDRLAAYVAAIIGALDASYNVTSTDGHVSVNIIQVDGAITSLQVLTSDIASAAALTTLTGRVSANESNLAGLHVQVDALTGQKYVTVTATAGTTSPTDVLPSSGQATDTIYRIGSWDGTQYDTNTYSEYAWDGTAYQFLDTKMVGIDDEPVLGSQNLAKSGGIYKQTKQNKSEIEFAIKNINELIIPCLIDRGNVVVGNYVAPNDGALHVNASYTAGGYIPISPETKYLFYEFGNLYGAWYDANKQYISGIQVDGYSDVSEHTSPSSAAYLRLSTQTSKFEGAYIMPYVDVMLDKRVSLLQHPTIINLDKETKSTNFIFEDKKFLITFDLSSFEKGENEFIYPTNGEVSQVNGYTAVLSYIEILPSTDYYFYHFTNMYGAWYDSNKSYISGITRDGTLPVSKYTAPSNAKYLRISTETIAITRCFISKSDFKLSQSITIGKEQVVGLVEQIKVTKLTVKPSGGGDFTKLSDCFDYITDSSFYNRYIVEFYGDGTEYDTLLDKPFVDGQIGLTVPPFTKLVGIGGKEKCILVRRLQQANVGDSLLNLYATSELEGFTLIAEKTRYCVHDDFYRLDELDLVNYERMVKNCNIYSTDTYYPSVWGSGTRSGVKWKFENCKFKNFNVSDRNDFTSHNNVNFKNPSQITFVNCRFSSSLGSRFGSLTTDANGIENYVFFYGCHLDKISLIEENATQLGTGILWKVSGYANNLITGSEDIVIINTDGVDYSANIDMI